MSRLKVTYTRNPAYAEDRADEPRLVATLDLAGFGLDTRVERLPVYFRHLERPVGPVLQVYCASIAGLQLEKGNLNSLEKTIDLYLGALIHFGRLPEYLFQIGQRAWPIYRLPDQLVARYPGIPVFSAESVGELRVALADYFKITGQMRNRKELGMLHLSPVDLQLVPPVCYLRGPSMVDIPIFPVAEKDATRLVAPVNASSLATPLKDGRSFLALQQEVGAYLAQKGRVHSPNDLTLRKLSPAAWAWLRQALQPSSRALSYFTKVEGRPRRLTLPVFEDGPLRIAARTNRLGLTVLYPASNLPQLRDRVGAELYEAGKIAGAAYVKIRASEAAIRDNEFRTMTFRHEAHDRG